LRTQMILLMSKMFRRSARFFKKLSYFRIYMQSKLN